MRPPCSLWLSALVVAPFPVLFLVTALARLAVPFELEWYEGQFAEHAWRASRGEPLYPAPDGDWVPLYTGPLYHHLVGSLFWLSGKLHLGWARVVSLTAALATGAAIFRILFDRTRDAAAAAIAVGVFYAFYEMSGYWYDIGRPDSLGYALAAWGLFFCLRRNPGPGSVGAGLVLLAAAAVTRQTLVLLGLYGGLWLLAKRPRETRMALLGVGLVALNLAVLYRNAGNDWLFEYLISPARHPTSLAKLLPDYQTPDAFRAGCPDPCGAMSWLALYLRQACASPPALWAQAGRHVWVLALLVAAGWIAAAARRRAPAGWMYALPAALLAAAALAGYLKYGGYLNNFMALGLALSITGGFAFHELDAAAPRGWRRRAVGVALALALFAQLFQPWRLPPHRGRTRGLAARISHGFDRWDAAGLLWRPSQQRPDPSSAEAWEELLAWLGGRRADGEDVWVMHHHWFGLLTGHPAGPNVDSVRDGQLAGLTLPPRIPELLRARRYTWLVLDMRELEHEWLPREVRAAIATHYEFAGLLPYVKRDPEALVPVTGAPMIPRALFLARPGGEAE